MIAAIFGLVGVFAGVLLTTVLDLWAKGRDAEKTRTKAARLLMAEMSWIVAAVKNADEKKQAPAFDTAEIIALWREYRDSFANLAYAEWKPVEQAVRLMAQPIWVSAKALSAEDFARASEEESTKLSEQYADAVARLGEATQVLARYAVDQKSRWRRLAPLESSVIQ